MNEKTYTLLHLSEVLGKDKQTIRRRIAKLKLKSINRDTREYPNQPLEYDQDTYLALANEFGLTTTYTQNYEEIELTASDVIDLCVEKYSELQVKEMELEFEDGAYLYSVEGFDDEKNYEIAIDPVSGTLLKIEEEISPETYWAVPQNSIDRVELIIDQVLMKVGENSHLHEWSLENEEGSVELSIEIILEDGTKVDFLYNFTTEQWVQDS